MTARQKSPLIWQGLLGPALVTALALVIFGRFLFSGKILAQGDAFLLFYPLWDFRDAALRLGQIPLWNPITFMGAPFLANSQYGVLYPLNWPLMWLSAPSAVKVAAIVHVLLAAAGTALFARRVMRLHPWAAWLAAGLFACGGYLTARVEQINQLQGLAWLPWVLWAAADLQVNPRRNTAPLAILLALQFLAGHTQTIAITGVGVAAFLTVRGGVGQARRQFWQGVAMPLVLLAAAGLLAAGLAAAQLLPTLELAGQSVRAGGLSVSEAISFSLDPRLLGHALLPGYARPLYSEYVATLGVSGLCLGLVGLLALRRAVPVERKDLISVAVVAGLGLFFALGGYNPFYIELVRYAPGFNLFRVPARWLALWAFGASALAGRGAQVLLTRPLTRREAGVCALAIAALAGLARLAAGLTPAGETGPLPVVGVFDGGWWLFALLAFAAIASVVRQAAWRVALIAGLAAIELVAVSRLQPFNNLTAPAAYYNPRPTEGVLLAQESDAQPAGRVLAQSRLFYDPTASGVPLPQAPAAAGLTPDETYRYIVAAKYQDVLTHNLAARWGLPTVDGYDGGILPLRNFVLFSEYLLGRPPHTTDGRLRESLDQVPALPPEGRALRLANVQYTISDQTFDAWLHGVYFDLSHHARLRPGATAQVGWLPDFAADNLQVISFLDGGAALPTGTPVAEIAVAFADGSSAVFTLRAGRETSEGDYRARNPAHRRAFVAGHYWPDHREVNDYWASFDWPAPRSVTSITVSSRMQTGEVVIRGLTLVNRGAGTFEPLVISSNGGFRLAYRGDVKVYDYLDTLPRAYVVPRVVVVSDNASALAAMRDPDFDPAASAVLIGGQPLEGGDSEATANIVEYGRERVVVQAEAAADSLLILSDAWYPGWAAAVDGQPAPIERADILFRAVRLPAGRHTVTFTYTPLSWRLGVWISLASLAGAAVLLWLGWFRRG